MRQKFRIGDGAFLVESNRTIREVKIIKYSGGMYTVKFTERDGGLKVRESRLYASREDAEKVIPKKKSRSVWDYS